MELMPGYKQTDVGVIPEDWELISIGKAGQVLGGRQRSPHYVGPLCKYLRVANVFDGFLKTEDVLEMPFSPAEKERFLLKVGDILLNEGQSIELVGRGAIYRGIPNDCCFQNTLLRFRSNRGTCREFAQVVFQRYRGLGVFASIASQTTSIAHLGAGRFAALQMPAPFLPEQRAIAKALSDADALIESLERFIAKKRHLKQGAMQELLRPKDGWVLKRLRDLGWTFGGLTGKTKSDFGEGKERYITFMNIMSNVLIDCGTLEYVKVSPGESQNRVMKGDLFFNGSSETPEEVGMCAILTEDLQNVFLNSFCFGFRFHKASEVDGIYLTYFFRSGQGRELLKSLAQGATRYNLSKIALLGLVFPIPGLSEQTAIASVFTDMDAEIAALETKLAKTRQLKQGMMQNLLTGKIRLI